MADQPHPLTEAPLGFGPGGPLPSPSPWIIHGSWIEYSNGGVVLGSPTGGNKGPGTLNAANVYLNGSSLDLGNYLPLTGGTIGGNLSVTGNLAVNGANLTLGNTTVLQGGVLDMGTF